MFLPDRITLPLWADSIAARVHMPVTFFEVFQASNFTAHFVSLLVVMAPLSILLPNPSRQPLTLKPSYRTAFACAAMLWLTLGWLGEQRTFLYFQF